MSSRKGGDLALDVRERLAIGALLHDVGKVVRRAGAVDRNTNHRLAGLDFTNKVKKFAIFQDFMLYHHESELSKKEREVEDLVWYVCLADNFSSSERMTEGEEFEELRRLDNLLSKIPESEEKENTYFPVKPVPEMQGAESEMKESGEAYERLYQKFLKDAERISLTPDDVNFLIYKYLSFVPQETRKEGEMDVSLYDHLKVTAMLALVMYDYVEENNLRFDSYKELKNYFSDPSKKPFLLVGGDVSGIQKFIANVPSKGALRSMRGRSFFIEILQEVVVDEILERTGFFRTNVHFVGGGHFYLVLSNTEKVKKTLETVQRELNSWFRKRGLSLHILIDSVPFSSGSIRDMSEIFAEVAEKINEKKYKMYSEEELREIFPDDLCEIGTIGTVTCRVCGNRVDRLFPLREDMEAFACDFCKKMYDLGRDLLDESNVYLVRDEKGEYEIFTKRFSFSKKPKETFSYKIRNIYEFEPEESMARRIQVVSYAKYQEFEKIAEETPGKRIASFVVDVDNLGKIFQGGLNRKTLSRYSTLSRLMSFFFKDVVSRVVSEKNVTVIYSGGDDLYLVGGWDDVLEVAKELREAFGAFTTNNFMSFSAGYVITDEKTSMSIIRKMSEQAEDRAKSEPGKNSIAFSNSRIPTRNEIAAFKWDKFFKMYDVYKKLSAIVGEVDRSVIQKALTITQEESPLNRAFLSYIEARENKEEDKELVAITRDSLEGIGELGMNVILQFLDLLARRDRNE